MWLICIGSLINQLRCCMSMNCISLVEKKPIAEGTRSRLIENYDFFAGKLADKEIQPAEVYESIGKLQIVNITLDRAVDDAQAE